MDNYTRVPKQKDQENTPRNEIRITSTGKTRRYISYGVALLDPTLLQHDDEDDKEQKQQQDNQTFDFIVLKGMGQAINKTVSIAEVIKRRVANLHQLNEIHSTTITDEWEPKSEGLEKQSTTRNVSAISITLSKKQLNVNDPGYQAPISADLIQPMQIAQPRKKKTTEEKVDNAATQGAEKTSDETAKKADPEKKKKKKKKPTKKKAPATDKSGEVTENKTEQKDETKTESAPKTAEKKPRAPRKKKVPQQANSEQSNAQQQVASEEQQGSNQSARSANSSRGRGRGVRRYRGRGGKKTADGAPLATSSPQTKSE